VEVRIAGKIYRPFLAQFRPSLTEVSHVALRGALLEMTDGTKGGAQRTSSLRPMCFGEVNLETATHTYLAMLFRNAVKFSPGEKAQLPKGLEFSLS
jgi:hypothetical protein